MRKKSPLEGLTDQEVLREFVKRFECDGAVLIYMENNVEFGFGKWTNSTGRKWVDATFKCIKQPISEKHIDIENNFEILINN